ncbi:MAG: hypothetical protein LBQ92_05910 [Propionibacteriaceae bacterium]|jgi:hypothetical protein|nr:hypothetical protein [Propionibacteriaceae bacterium]
MPVHRLSAIALSGALALGMLPAAADALPAEGPAGVSPGLAAGAAAPAKLSASNLTVMEVGKTYTVKMGGKARTAKLASKCTYKNTNGCWIQEISLKIGSKKLKSRQDSDAGGPVFTLAKVTSKETLVVLTWYGKKTNALIYRFNGKKLVKLATASRGAYKYVAAKSSGAGKLTTCASNTFGKCEQPTVWKYANGKLKAQA